MHSYVISYIKNGRSYKVTCARVIIDFSKGLEIHYYNHNSNNCKVIDLPVERLTISEYLDNHFVRWLI